MRFEIGRALQAVAERRAAGHPTMVAIDGRSGVGKSTFAAELARALSATLIEGDDFFAGGTVVRNDTAAERVDDCIDWRRQRAVLELLKQERPASWFPFDWHRFNGELDSKPTSCEPASVVLLEGVYSGRPELSDLVDVRILLVLPEEVRLARLVARDGPIEAWARQWHEAEDDYFARIAPPESFDLVLGGVEVGGR